MRRPKPQRSGLTAAAYLDAAAALTGRREPRGAAPAFGVRLLARKPGAADADLAETAIVYDTVARQLGDVIGLQPPAVFVALTELCEDDEARALVSGEHPPSADALRTLRDRIVWITVTYEARNGSVYRAVTATYRRPGETALWSRREDHDIGWDALPSGARERLRADDTESARYQVFPPSD